MQPRKVIIMGAGGRDLHNFTTFFRDNDAYEVVALTVTQVPFLAGRSIPPEVAGPRYPDGIHLFDEAELERLIVEFDVDVVAYSVIDVSHEHVMHIASRCLAAGTDFMLLGPKSTMLKASKPVVAVTAVRTGSGKSPTARRVCDVLLGLGKKVIVFKHPNPYGDLAEQAFQRFETFEDLDRHECSIEEREEYEPHIARGITVYTGIETRKVLKAVEEEAEVIVWDGGNNDLPFLVPDVHIVVADPHRAGHEITYHAGESNLRRADVVVINKVDTADPEGVATVRRNVSRYNPRAVIIEAASPIFVDDPALIQGKSVLAIEDGPTLTHGGMTYGAGVVAAQRFGAAELVDPRPYAAGSITEVFEKYPHIGPLLPAMGYGDAQMEELRRTIEAVPCDLVLVATPIDLQRVIQINKAVQRVRYELQEIGQPTLVDVLRPLA